MKVKTSNLSGIALDWAVTKSENLGSVALKNGKMIFMFGGEYSPSTYWSQGGQIIEQEKMSLVRGNDLIFPKGNENGDMSEALYLARYSGSNSWTHGQTPLIAAMRCFVASKLGNEVEVPDEIAANM